MKIIASFERIEVTPSVRAFAIQRSRRVTAPLRVLEVFSGGGTMTQALEGLPALQVVAGVEIEPAFADEWHAQHRDAALHSMEVPAFD